MGVLRPEEPRLSGCPSPLATLSKAAVRAVQAMNRICVLDVDLQGVRNIKKTDLQPIYIFVQPPSLEVLVGAWAGAGAGVGLGPGQRQCWGQPGWGCSSMAALRALTFPCSSGTASATAEHRDRGEPGQAPGRRPGRHGKQ